MEKADEVGALARQAVQRLLSDLALVEEFVAVVVPETDAVERSSVVELEIAVVLREAEEAVTIARDDGDLARGAFGSSFFVARLHDDAPGADLVGLEADHPQRRPIRRVVEAPDFPGLAARRGEFG